MFNVTLHTLQVHVSPARRQGGAAGGQDRS